MYHTGSPHSRVVPFPLFLLPLYTITSFPTLVLNHFSFLTPGLIRLFLFTRFYKFITSSARVFSSPYYFFSISPHHPPRFNIYPLLTPSTECWPPKDFSASAASYRCCYLYNVFLLSLLSLLLPPLPSCHCYRRHLYWVVTSAVITTSAWTSASSIYKRKHSRGQREIKPRW